MAGSDPNAQAPEPNLARCRVFAGSLHAGVDATVIAFGRAVESLMGHRADAGDHLEAALAADPNLVAAHLLRGFALRTLGRRDLMPGIRAALAAAESSMKECGVGAREQALFDALKSWSGGCGPKAADILDRRLADEPCDLLLIKLAHAIRFMLGDCAGMLESLAKVVPAFSEGDDGLGFVLGCRAFALEEVGEFEAAEATARHGLDLEPRDAWGLHALVHVHFERGEAAAGLSSLAANESRFEGLNNFAGHLAWHEALFQVEQSRPAFALDLYDRRIAIYPPRDYRDFSNASSLLILLEGRGLDLVARWKALATIARERFHDHGSAFADLHYVLALAASGRREEASRFVAAMRRTSLARAERAKDRGRDHHDARVSLEVGIPVSEAIVEACLGRRDRARAQLGAFAGSTRRLGGSRAQRRVLDWVMQDPEARSAQKPNRPGPDPDCVANAGSASQGSQE
ncbi:MAG: tetratricopeptide repeat protein [Planctomycetota bacterium]